MHTELGIHLDRLIDILQSLREGGQLGICGSAVIVSSWVGRVTLDTLCIVLDSPYEVTSLELGIPFLTSGMTLLRIDVGLLVFFSLETLSFA